MSLYHTSFIMLTECFTVLLVISGLHCANEGPVVKTPLGTIRGSLKTSYNGRKFAAFEGIPYAKPPIGNLRFGEPEPVEPWYGVWNANHPSECVQTSMVQLNTTSGDEDCLHVNVYVPRESPNPGDKLEVVVHIHGGAYMYCNGHAYNPPDIPMDRDFIFVTFNYRLGILGFLSTEDEVVPGNNGLKDQTLALKWVKQNIASFGGNQDSITLMGLSAGGSSVHFHYFSELSKGLFHRGFSQSGVALNPWSIAEAPLSKAKKLADAVGCPTESTSKLVDCLKQRPYKQIMDKLSLFFTYKFMPIVPFGPVVEKGGSRPFLRAEPYELLRKGQVQDLPWVASMASHEGLFPVMFFLEDLDYINDHWNELAPSFFEYNYTAPPSAWDNISQKIKNHYLGAEKLSQQNMLKLVQIFSDRYFLNEAETSVRLQAKATKSPVYFFIFGYPGEKNVHKTAGHGSEARYMYGSNSYAPEPLTEKDVQMKDLLWDLVVSYADTGKPSFKRVEWTRTKHDPLTYLRVDGVETEEIQLQTTEELTNRNFWKQLQIAENENLVRSKEEL